MKCTQFTLPPIIILMLCLHPCLLGVHLSEQTNPNELVLFEFHGSGNTGTWRIINDGVMGGLSRGQFVYTDRSTALFQGTVSLENNGGFSSVRTMMSHVGLAGFSGILLRIKGDGKKYQFRIRTNENFDGVSYQYQFVTQASTWIEVDLPFSGLLPVYRGRVLDSVKALSPAEIQQIGFLVSDYQAGEFQLEIDWIKAYKN